MAELEQDFETLEDRLMRAWLHRDAREAKGLIGGDFICMFGTNPPVLLDKPSFLAAISRDFRCNAFRFNETTARQHGAAVWFTAHVELELAIGPQAWTGNFLLTDLWRKSRFRRRWQVAERSLALADNKPELSDAIRRLQLWR